jgi:predicted dehydrogenase
VTSAAVRGTRPLGVGVIGAGPVTQAIHLPTLATLTEEFRVAHVMDVDLGVAREVAERVGARAGTDLDTLLADDAVDVVVICSPHQFHADQVAAAAAAGKRGVLCEKPLATTVAEAQRIADVSASSGIPVVVGAMHVYDPAVMAARQALAELATSTRLVRVRTYLPSNDDLVNLSTDLVSAPPRPTTGPEPDELDRQAAVIRGGVLGLATHDLPLVRAMLPRVEEVTGARALAPWGYELSFRCGHAIAQLQALMPGAWEPDWTLQAWGPDHEFGIAFPPSYVLAGSSTAGLATAAGRTSWQYPVNGYQAEWLHLADIVNGRAEPAVPVQDAVEDLLYALQIADGAEKLIREAA